MHDEFEVQPLPQRERRNLFLLLVGLFVITLPFLFLYATGYRFDFGQATPFISTGGLYVAAERTGAEIYIDNELVRETRTFRKAFYAQGLEPGTHRVHVQKPGHHTWVKELPVYPHLVTEAQAFNVPLVPRVRTISPWKNAVGQTVLFDAPTTVASSTNATVVATTTATRGLIPDTEYATLIRLFTATTTGNAPGQIQSIFNATGTDAGIATPTSTKIFNGVQLSQNDGDVFATYVGPRGQMPYYYCAKDFEFAESPVVDVRDTEKPLIGPVQYIPEDVVCEPTIEIDRKGEEVRGFDFYPNSSDFVLMGLTSGMYVVEVDSRSWQNVQSLFLGEGLDFRIQNGSIYVYDGELIYQILLES
jgi:hypothetical protein